jgi:phosphoglycolate phosphatase/pyrophosphatase PpaX
MLKGIIFDMDGTLGDTQQLCIEAYRGSVRELTGRTPSAEEVVSYFGLSDRGVLGGLLGINPDAPELPIDTFVRIYCERHDELAPTPFPGATELLWKLKEKGLKLALLTGKEHYTAEPTVRKYGMEGVFDLQLYGDPYYNAKADNLKRAMDAWQLSPQEIIYVGDAPSDISLCHSVGVPIINAAWCSHAATEQSACLALAPEYRLSSFDALEPLISKLTS